MIAVCTLGCTRKRHDLHSWSELMNLDGDYSLYINWEAQDHSPDMEEPRFLQVLEENLKDLNPLRRLSIDWWQWNTLCGSSWRAHPRFDQDQARLSSIVTARNMCVEYAIQTDASHLMFIDADIIPPRDILTKLLEVNRDAALGMVYGRGTHAACPYIFGEKRRFHENGFELIEVEHGNIGYALLTRKLIENIRFRYGRSRYPDGRESMISDDPAFHLDAFLKFGEWPVIRKDTLAQHVGDLKAEEVSQF